MASNEQVEQLRRTLECSICQEQTADPRTLPCLHSYCEKCLTRHVAEKGDHGVFPCPLCNAQFAIPEKGVTGFKQNFFIANISEILLKNCCDICKIYGRDVQALFLCIQCRKHLCKECSQMHCRHIVDHRVVSLDEVRNGQHMDEIRRHQKVYCSVHKDKVLKFYCEQCEIPVCSCCHTSDHNNHKVKGLNETASNASKVMRNLLGPWRNATKHWKMLCEKRQQMLQSLGQEHEACESGIKRLFSDFLAEITRQVKVHEESAIDQLDAQVEAAKKQAETACDEAELNRREFENVLQYVNKILASAHDVEKLQQFKEIRKRLGNLNVDQVETQLVEKITFEFRPSKLVIPDLGVKVATVLKNENISLKCSQKSATNVTVSCKSPVHRVTPQLAVKERAQLVRRFSSLLEGEGGGGCRGLAVGDGGLVVTDMLNQNVKVFDKCDFTFKFTLNQTTHQFQLPADVTWNRNREIFITDWGIHGVVKYDATGRLVKIYPGIYKGEGFITCHRDQLIVADTDGGRVMFTDYKCKARRQVDAYSLGLSKFSPGYVCVDKSTGHLVASQQGPGRVHVIDDKRPAIVNTYSDKLGKWPCGVCVDQLGNIFVADISNHQVILFTNMRAHVIIAAGDVRKPSAICVSAPGQVSVLEHGGDVKIFSYLDISL